MVRIDLCTLSVAAALESVSRLTRAAYVQDHLAQLPPVNPDDRSKLVDGAKQDLDTTLPHLVDHRPRCLFVHPNRRD